MKSAFSDTSITLPIRETPPRSVRLRHEPDQSLLASTRWSRRELDVAVEELFAMRPSLPSLSNHQRCETCPSTDMAGRVGLRLRVREQPEGRREMLGASHHALRRFGLPLRSRRPE